MPYSKNSDLPQAVRENYTDRCQSVFREVFNQDFAKNKNESRAFAVANTAAKNCMKATHGDMMDGQDKNP